MTCHFATFHKIHSMVAAQITKPATDTASLLGRGALAVWPAGLGDGDVIPRQVVELLIEILELLPGVSASQDDPKVAISAYATLVDQQAAKRTRTT